MLPLHPQARSSAFRSSPLHAIHYGTNGTTNIQVVATDKAGNTSEKIVNVYRDTKGPDIVLKNLSSESTIEETTSGYNNENKTFTVKGSWNDNGGSGYNKLEYSLNNSNWTEITSDNLNWEQAIS